MHVFLARIMVRNGRVHDAHFHFPSTMTSAPQDIRTKHRSNLSIITVLNDRAHQQHSMAERADDLPERFALTESEWSTDCVGRFSPETVIVLNRCDFVVNDKGMTVVSGPPGTRKAKILNNDLILRIDDGCGLHVYRGPDGPVAEIRHGHAKVDLLALHADLAAVDILREKVSYLLDKVAQLEIRLASQTQ